MFGKRKNSAPDVSLGPPFYSDEDIIECLLGLRRVEFETVERHSELFNSFNYKWDGLFCRLDMKAAHDRSFGYHDLTVGTYFEKGFITDESFFNLYNKRMPKAYAINEDYGAVICLKGQCVSKDLEHLKNTVSHAVISHGRCIIEFGLLRNHFIEYGNIDNVTFDPKIFI